MTHVLARRLGRVFNGNPHLLAGFLLYPTPSPPNPCTQCSQVERNLVDAMGVARNICLDPRLVPGGGACEMAVSRGLTDTASSIQGVESGPYKSAGQAMEVIPRTLAQNCGANVIRTLTKLRAKHAEEPGCSFGINGDTGEVRCASGVWGRGPNGGGGGEGKVGGGSLAGAVGAIE